jgi:hypothetical protein
MDASVSSEVPGVSPKGAKWKAGDFETEPVAALLLER